MRHAFSSVIVAMVMVATANQARAQTVGFQAIHPGQSGQCDFAGAPLAAPIMLTCVDWADVDSGVIAGWSGNRNTGHRPQSVQVWHVDPVTNHPTVLADATIAVWRPDVAAAIGVHNQTLGWGITTGAPLQPGLYIVLVTDVPYSGTCGYDAQNRIWCGYVANQVQFRVR